MPRRRLSVRPPDRKTRRADSTQQYAHRRPAAVPTTQSAGQPLKHQARPASPERVIAFTFVLRLVGDLHQLHTADHNDVGGNGVLALSARRPDT
jgi:hypothetical protein